MNIENVVLLARRSAEERNKIACRFEEERNKIARRFKEERNKIAHSFGGERNKIARSFWQKVIKCCCKIKINLSKREANK